MITKIMDTLFCCFNCYTLFEKIQGSKIEFAVLGDSHAVYFCGNCLDHNDLNYAFRSYLKAIDNSEFELIESDKED